MKPIHDYYRRSRTAGTALLLGAGLLVACAGANEEAKNADSVSFAALNGPDREAARQKLLHLPVVLHVEKGTRIPLELQLDSKLARLDTRPMTLVAKRDFFLLIRSDGPPLLSEDGVDYESKPKNYFSLGLAAKRDRDALIRLRLGVRPDGTIGPH